jgi:lipoprotein NlpI
MLRPMKAHSIIVSLAMLFLAGGPPAVAAPAENPLLDQARRAFQSGNREEAVRIASRMIEGDPKEPNNYFLRARFQELMGRREAALADYTKLLEIAPHATEVHYHRGVIHFLLARIPESVADFDRLVEAQPDKVPHQWQRGIALYYAGRYDDGRKQFEMHRTVNPADVENSAWHFLCVARDKGVEEARKKLIPVSGDPRVPMAEILDLYAGRTTPEKVMERVDSSKIEPIAKPAQLLYAHLYLALYYEATGSNALRRSHLQKAVDTNLRNEYMWEVARVHLELLNSGRLK